MSSLPHIESAESLAFPPEVAAKTNGLIQRVAQAATELLRRDPVAEVVSTTDTEAVQLLETSVENGLRIDYLRVSDGYEHLPERAIVQADLNIGEEYLRQNPEATADPKTFNPVRDRLDENPAFGDWRKLMPSALALYPLQLPDIKHLPNAEKTPMDAGTRELFRHGLDAIGIRTRAQVMTWLSVQQAQLNPEQEMKWVSLACGAAVPVLDALKEIKEEVPGKVVRTTFVDWNDRALEFAGELAAEQGLQEGKDFEFEKSDLMGGLVRSDKFVQRHGENSFDMVDMLGIFEYFNKDRAVKMLRNAHRLLKPGGKLILGNMLKSHPNMLINEKAVGWPGIKPRSIDDIMEIIVEAGVSPELAHMYIPEDGVYAVVALEKKSEDEQATTDNIGLATVHSIQRSISQNSA